MLVCSRLAESRVYISSTGALCQTVCLSCTNNLCQQQGYDFTLHYIQILIFKMWYVVDLLRRFMRSKLTIITNKLSALSIVWTFALTMQRESIKLLARHFKSRQQHQTVLMVPVLTTMHPEKKMKTYFYLKMSLMKPFKRAILLNLNPWYMSFNIQCKKLVSTHKALLL